MFGRATIRLGIVPHSSLRCLYRNNFWATILHFSRGPLAVPHHNRFTALFPGPPGWAGARRELLDFMVQGKINRGRHIDPAAGRHSIQTNQCPPPPSPAGCSVSVVEPCCLAAVITTVWDPIWLFGAMLCDNRSIKWQVHNEDFISLQQQTDS